MGGGSPLAIHFGTDGWRATIADVPDGTYYGEAFVDSDGVVD